MSTSAAQPGLSTLRWNAAQRIARQQARETIFGWGFYIAAAIALLIAIVLVYNSVQFVGDTALNVVHRPFFLPLQAVTTVALLFVTIEAALGVARPREQGSLQVLFFAPVDGVTFLTGNLLAGLIVYVFLLLLLLLPLALLAWVTNFIVPPALIWGLLPTVLIAAVTISFGLVISTIAPSGRAAVLILVAAMLALLVIQAGYAALLGLPPTSRFYDALLFMRLLLHSLQEILLYVSPFRLLDATLAAALRGDIVSLGRYLLVALSSMVVWMTIAIVAFRRRGVLQ